MAEISAKILIIGGSRGLGAALRYEFASTPLRWTTRSPLDGLELAPIALDLGNSHSINSFVSRLGNDLYKTVIFCAADTEFQTFPNELLGGNLNSEAFSRALYVNCFAPLRIAQELIKNERLVSHALLLFISSKAGSIELRGHERHHVPGGPAIYRISKAALNCGVRNLAFDLRESTITVVALDPGWVRTNRYSQSAAISSETAARDIANLVQRISPTDSGLFIDRFGNQIPW